MATFFIPKFQLIRHGQVKEDEKREKKNKKKHCKIVPTTFVQQVACAQNCNMAICPACRPGTLYRQQVAGEGLCCANRSKITSRVNNKCGVGFACVGRGKCGLPCTLQQPPNPCPCTACSCLPDPLPCGVVCLGTNEKAAL